MKKIKILMLVLTIVTTLCFLACLIVWIVTACLNKLSAIYIVATSITLAASTASWVAFALLLKEFKKPTQMSIFDENATVSEDTISEETKQED